MKLYCLSLYYKSPSAYRFLRNTFSIPSVRTLQRIFDKFQIDCGFSADLLSVLKKRVSTMSEKADMPPGTDCPYPIRILAFFEMIRPYHVVIRI